MTELRLGKKPAAPRPTDLKLGDYLDRTALPPVPAQFGHEDRMPLPRLMLGNGPDESVAPGFQGAGDCVFAMICNAVRLANALAGRTVPITGKEAIAAYSAVTGYVIGDASTDNGTDMHNALDWWRNTGLEDAAGTRHQLGAYLSLDITNLAAELEALYILDIGVGIGIVFPASAMMEFNQGQPWTATGGTSDGGHAILWDAHRDLETVETWATDQKATAAFLAAQVDEAYALLTPEMLAGGVSAEGFDLAALTADLAAL